MHGKQRRIHLPSLYTVQASHSGIIILLQLRYSPVATPICSIVNLVAVRSVLFFDMEVITWVYSWYLAWLPERQLWGTLVICINARWPLRTPGRLRMGYHSTNLNTSCVTPLYQILFTRGIDFWVNFVIRGQSIGQRSSSMSFSVK